VGQSGKQLRFSQPIFATTVIPFLVGVNGVATAVEFEVEFVVPDWEGWLGGWVVGWLGG
jgi:hypothetical protein